jgi:hypothetical protein
MAEEQPIQPLNLGQFNNILRDLISYYDHTTGFNGTYASPIPVVISLDIDGVAGIKVGNLFNITGAPGEILPASFRGINVITNNTADKRDIAFLVKSMGHSVEGNYWTTHIEGYPYVYPTNLTKKDPKKTPTTKKYTEETVTNNAIKNADTSKPKPNTPPKTSYNENMGSINTLNNTP